MRKEVALLAMTGIFLLASCGPNVGPIDSASNSSGASDQSLSSSDSSASSSSSVTVPDNEKLSAKGIFNRMTRISEVANYRLTRLDRELKRETSDTYTEKYIVNENDMIAYVLLDSVEDGHEKSVYTIGYDRLDANGKHILRLGTAYADRDVWGQVTGAVSDLRNFDYMRLFNEFSGQDKLFTYSAFRPKAGYKGIYVTTNEYILRILSYASGYSTYISTEPYQADLTYDENGNLVFYLFSNPSAGGDEDFANSSLYAKRNASEEGGGLLKPQALEPNLDFMVAGVFVDIGSAKNEEIESFLASSKDCVISKEKVGGNAFDLIDAYPTGYSVSSKATFTPWRTGVSEDSGTIDFDYSSDRMNLNVDMTYTKGHELVSHDEKGYAVSEFLGGDNKTNKDTNYDMLYANIYSPGEMEKGGWRKVEGEDYYLYYGAYHWDLFKGLTMIPLDSDEFGIQRVEGYADSSGRINKLLIETSLGYLYPTGSSLLFGRYTFECDIQSTPRAIEVTAPLTETADTKKIDSLLKRLSGGAESVKTVAVETLDESSSTSKDETITSYYDGQVVYREKESFYGTTSGFGYYLKKNAGVVYFESSIKDGELLVTPLSAPDSTDTLLQHWLPISTDAKALEFDKDRTSVVYRDGIEYPQLSAPHYAKGYYGISHASESSMSNLRYALNADQSAIESLTYNYSAPSKGHGEVRFLYGEEAALPDGLLAKLEAMATYTNPTKWSEARSQESATLVKDVNAYFEGTGASIENVPYLFDALLDGSWRSYRYKSSSSNAAAYDYVEIYTNRYSGEGDINDYLLRYRALCKSMGFTSFVYTDYRGRKFDGFEKDGLYITLGNSVHDGIYLYKADPRN